ncbi:MAG: class IV adenylate cyclase [Planctomycetales bacterium]|nr:class IV adenylate cyclase [Planctomycetales bacterium]
MHVEVEQKFRVADLAEVRTRLQQLGAAGGDVCEQADCYYRHPARDFAATDEAFRLRRVGERSCFTYKGPKLDAATKTRVEREVELAPGADNAAAADEVVRRLGFEPVTTVAKRRETWRLAAAGYDLEAALDDVMSVGLFVELEIVVETRDEGGAGPEVDAARAALGAAAVQLGLDSAAVERRSYLELLLQAKG